ncbi:MAG TPA: patatin family protein [Prolixibacteraceae bacterium]|nr:patatin family protein [Prolixibacteraceae bacterium]HPR84639.1 patatin family protein [Prolixibacteraceae bacterium]
MENSCLVLEGGGLRGAFTSGVLEYLLDEEFWFDRVVGVSAGACVGASYISKQKGRNRKVNVEMPSDKRYMGFRHLLTTGSYFNMEFVFDEIPHRLVPFDESAFYDSPAEFEALTTSLESGKACAFNKADMQKLGIENILIASSSIPLLAKAVDVGGKLYFDGGVSDSIPVEFALEKHSKAVVVLTRPREYRKEEMKGRKLFEIAFRKYPDFLDTLLNRNEAYNRTLDLCEAMEREGRIFIFAPLPEFSVGRTEKSLERRMALYDHGYQLMREKFGAMKQFLEID